MEVTQILGMAGDVASVGVFVFLATHHADIKTIKDRLKVLEEVLWQRH